MTPEDDGLVQVFVDALSERFAGVGTTVTDPGAVRAQVSSEAPPLPPIDLPVVADENADGVLDGTNVLKLFCNPKGAVTLETAKLENEQEKVIIDERGRSLQVANIFTV